MADNFLEGAGSVSDPGLLHLAPTLFSGSQELLTSTFVVVPPLNNEPYARPSADGS